VFIDMVGVGLIAPIFPDLIIKLSDLSLAKAATVSGYLLFLYALMMFLAAPLVGALSDRFGRRPVAVLAITGLAIDYLIMAYTQTLALLFIGRALAGIFGATYPVANAMVADVELPDNRAKSFGVVAAAGGLGFILGPAIGGLLASFGLRAPFLLAAALCGAICLVTYFFFFETLPDERRTNFCIKKINPLGSIMAIGFNNNVWMLFLALFFFQLAFQSIATLWAFFGSAQFQWEAMSIGISIAVYGLLVAAVQGVLVNSVIVRVGEGRTGELGIGVAIVGYLGLSIVSSQIGLYLLIAMLAVSGLAFPAMQSMMSRQTSEHQQGELQGAIASIVSVSSIVGPIVTSQIFFWATAETMNWPGAPFVVSAVSCMIALALLTNFKKWAAQSNDQSE
jgi:DHA1 family tetracycline resistance protein-like MFS transporter